MTKSVRKQSQEVQLTKAEHAIEILCQVEELIEVIEWYVCGPAQRMCAEDVADSWGTIRDHVKMFNKATASASKFMTPGAQQSIDRMVEVASQLPTGNLKDAMKLSPAELAIDMKIAKGIMGKLRKEAKAFSRISKKW